MRRLTTTLLLAASIAPVLLPILPSSAAAPAVAQKQATPTALPVTTVQLFSSGVGYFEHVGTVTGNDRADLRFTNDQINDVLKSLVLQDLGGGTVSAVTYPSTDPLTKTLSSFAIDLTRNPSVADLLGQLRGTAVTLDAEGGMLHGTVLGLEVRKRVLEGPPVEVINESILNVLSGGRIMARPLSAIRSVVLDDARLQDELNKALATLAAAHDDDKKPFTIVFKGSGARTVRIGYVVQAPVWKTSYRLLLSDRPAKAATTRPADADLQGWAIVENQTDNDWTNVNLSLVSGRPMSFIQDLYQPRYIDRPVVNPQLFASLLPQSYGGAMRELKLSDKAALVSAKDSRARAGGGEQNLFSVAAEAAPAGPVSVPMNAASSVHAIANGAALGELFQYMVNSVSLPRRQSSMFPIITDPIDVRRVSIYNAAVLADHPLNGAKVINTTKKHLLAGPVTVLDGGAYAGDAQIDNLPPGQHRLISYGIDLQTHVDTGHRTAIESIETAKIVKGTLLLTRKYVRSVDYAIDNQADHDKDLVIEHPREAGWSLVDTKTPGEKTNDRYRFDLAVAAGKQATLTVREQMVQAQSVGVISTDPETFESYRQSGQIAAPVLAALQKAVALKQAASSTQQLIDRDKSELADITTEQNRLRDNLKAVQPTSTYYERIMAKLNDQETRVEKLHSDVEAQQKKLASQEEELTNYLNGLNVG